MAASKPDVLTLEETCSPPKPDLLAADAPKLEHLEGFSWRRRDLLVAEPHLCQQRLPAMEIVSAASCSLRPWIQLERHHPKLEFLAAVTSKLEFLALAEIHSPPKLGLLAADACKLEHPAAV